MTEHAKKDPIELEKRLAEALGYVDVEVSSRADGSLVGRMPGEKSREFLPRWARDNGAAYSLMVEQQLSPGFMGYEEGKGQRRVVSDQTKLWAIAYTGEHGHDEEAAVRAANVMGGTAKIEMNAHAAPKDAFAKGPSAG